MNNQNTIFPDKSGFFRTDELQPAPENKHLYDDFAPQADSDDAKLYWSIKENGIQEPLHISKDMIILSGHRRHAAAEWLGMESVPCIVRDVVFSELDQNEKIKQLAIYNKQRDKSNAEKTREAMIGIEQEKSWVRLLQDRQKQLYGIEDNVFMGAVKKRSKILSKAFLAAAIKAINSEREYWPMTDRRIHYLLLNDPPLKHDKKPDSIYQNDANSYKTLTNLLLRARLTGDIPHIAIEDSTRPILNIASYQNPSDYVVQETASFCTGYYRDLMRGQRDHIEILVEKNAIRKQVEKVAIEYSLKCTTGRGYSSLTPRLKMVERFRSSGKKNLILLILSDFDPDGDEIAASFPRSLRDDFGIQNVKPHKVMLSADDVLEYNLPCDMEAKISSPNYKKFLARHGSDRVAELDAAPIELLQRKLRSAIESCIDMDIFNMEVEQEKLDSVYIHAKREMVMQLMAA